MTRMSVKEAATVLGITPRAVRLRIEEKRIPATMIDGKWFVDVDGSFPPSEDGRMEAEADVHTADTHEQPSFRPSPEGRQEVEVPPQFRAVMEQWVNPLVVQIREQAEEIGKLRAEVTHRDELIATLNTKSGEDVISQRSYESRQKSWLQRLMGL